MALLYEWIYQENDPEWIVTAVGVGGVSYTWAVPTVAALVDEPSHPNVFRMYLWKWFPCMMAITKQMWIKLRSRVQRNAEELESEDGSNEMTNEVEEEKKLEPRNSKQVELVRSTRMSQIVRQVVSQVVSSQIPSPMVSQMSMESRESRPEDYRNDVQSQSSQVSQISKEEERKEERKKETQEEPKWEIRVDTCD